METLLQVFKELRPKEEGTAEYNLIPRDSSGAEFISLKIKGGPDDRFVMTVMTDRPQLLRKIADVCIAAAATLDEAQNPTPPAPESAPCPACSRELMPGEPCPTCRTAPETAVNAPGSTIGLDPAIRSLVEHEAKPRTNEDIRRAVQNVAQMKPGQQIGEIADIVGCSLTDVISALS